MLEKIEYSEESDSGIIWKVTSGKVKVDSPAGFKRADGYWRVGKAKEYVHRLIWRLFNGDIPENMSVDHIDGNPSNNKVSNLRLVSHKENMRNNKRNKNNKSGKNGVSIENIRGFQYWSASWHQVDGKQQKKRFSIEKLGYEEALSLAIEARSLIEIELGHFSERHGKV